MGDDKMKNYLFHGSYASGIETLQATSKLHGTEDTMVVYLTANPVYALFYIWDAEHNKRTGKYVTSFIKNGLVNNGIVKQPDCEEALFYQTYFAPVWRMALERAEANEA